MQKKKPGVDVIMDVLIAALRANPSSAFLNSLHFQYQERGGLSKKQLQGLHAKASKMADISPAKLATLEAIILKKPTRFKSETPLTIAPDLFDETSGQLIKAILEKYPAHKRVLYYKARFDKKENFTAAEKEELEKFARLLLK